MSLAALGVPSAPWAEGQGGKCSPPTRRGGRHRCSRPPPLLRAPGRARPGPALPQPGAAPEPPHPCHGGITAAGVRRAAAQHLLADSLAAPSARPADTAAQRWALRCPRAPSGPEGRADRSPQRLEGDALSLRPQSRYLYELFTGTDTYRTRYDQGGRQQSHQWEQDTYDVDSPP